MNRLQISLTSEQYEFLKSEAFVTGQSMAAVLRHLLDKVIEARQKDVLENDPIWQVIGVGEEIEGPGDASANVDRYLYGQRTESVPDIPVPQVAETADEYTAD